MDEPILAGVRVVDLSWGLAGPVATHLLAEAGADVVKVEPPGGDPMRAHAGFATWNRSKSSLVLDLGDSNDRARLDDLLVGADVLVHCLRPADARARNLDDDSLATRFPHLVVSAVTGYPLAHPDADRPGYDCLVQARMGLMDEQLGHRPGPVFIRFPVPSWGAAYLAASAVLARLLARDRTGRGGAAHTSLLQGALVTMTMHWLRAERPTPAFAFGLPKDLQPSLYECSDGVWLHVMRQVSEVPLVAQTMEELGDERIAAARANDSASYWGDHGATKLAFRQRPSPVWLDALWAADVPVLPAQPLGEILNDEQVRTNHYVVEIDDPVWGRSRQAGTPFHTTPPSRVRGSAPVLGSLGQLPRWEARQVPQSSATSLFRSPLAGVRVLDFGNYVAGPFAAMLLADLGADVIKVEPVTGDPMRGVERVFAGTQRGKRAVSLDLKHPEAREVLAAFVPRADVVHHNIRYPAARKLGIDYDSLRPLNPTMVYCHTSAYGPKGPRADWPGYDQLFQAYSGWEVEGGGEGNPPMWHRMGMMDHQNALASLVATLLALVHRQRTGEGQMVTASILGASALTASETLLRADGSAAPFARLDSAQTGLAPWYRIYETTAGWVAVAAVSADAQKGLLAAAGVDEVEDVEIAFSKLAAADVLTRLEEVGLAAELVRLEQGEPFLSDPANHTARLVTAHEHAVYGRLEQIGALWDLGELEVPLERPPPVLGQHTLEVLTEVGMTTDDLERLARAGVIAGDGLPEQQQ